VVPVKVTPPGPPPGSTPVQVGAAVQGNGPSVEVQVVVWPVQITDSGQDVIVIMFVVVIVELPYEVLVIEDSGGRVVLGSEEGSEEDEGGSEVDVGGEGGEVGHGRYTVL